MDDVLVKSHVLENNIDDLEETFTIPRKCQMKLNPAKCDFGVTSSKFH